jgi:hypothetical protein
VDSSNGLPFRETQLIGLLVDILRELHPEARIVSEPSVGPRQRVDILYFEGDAVYAVEVKANQPQTQRRLEELLVQLADYRDAIETTYRTSKIAIILAIPGEFTPEKTKLLGPANVTLWDRQWILEAAEKTQRLREAQEILGAAALRYVKPRPEMPRPPGPTLQEQLQSVPKGKPSWSLYQKLCKNIFEHLFCPPLSSPIEESSNEAQVSRRDFVVPNYANDGFWMFMRTHYRADYVVVDAKNLTGFLTKSHVLQVCNYMTPHGTGLFGILATRNGSSRAADYTRREQWVLHGKLVIVLVDDDLQQMLRNLDSGDDPTVVIRQKIEDFRLAI